MTDREPASPASAPPFAITRADLGRHVRRISTGQIGYVDRDPGNSWLHPDFLYEWRVYRNDLEYVTVTKESANPSSAPPEILVGRVRPDRSTHYICPERPGFHFIVADGESTDALLQTFREFRLHDAALAPIEPLLEAMRRHIRSYEPGTLMGSELNVATHLRDLDGEVWAPWCEPGEVEYETDAALSAQPRAVTPPVYIDNLTEQQRAYLDDLKARHVSYDPKMTIGIPQQVEGAAPQPGDAETHAQQYGRLVEKHPGTDTGCDLCFLTRTVDERNKEILRLRTELDAAQSAIAYEKGNTAEAVVQINKTLQENQRLQTALAESKTEVARLHELFRIDGEQHARAIKEARHEQDARLKAYSDEISRLRSTTGNYEPSTYNPDYCVHGHHMLSNPCPKCLRSATATGEDREQIAKMRHNDWLAVTAERDRLQSALAESRQEVADFKAGFEAVEKQCRKRGLELREVQAALAESQTEVARLQTDLRLAQECESAFQDEAQQAQYALAEGEKRNFALAANQCHAPWNDEYGNHRCHIEDRLRETQSALAASRAEFAEYRKAAVAAYDKLGAELGAAQSALAESQGSRKLWHEEALIERKRAEDVEIARLRSATAAGEDMEAAQALLLGLDYGNGAVDRVAEAIAAARAQGERDGIERAAKKAEDFGHTGGRIRASHKHVAAAIRALAPEPQEEKL